MAKQTCADVIHECMSGNPDFPNPAPSMAEFGQALAELKEANINALDRGRSAIINKNIAEDRITRMITALAGYVNSVCMGDTKMILRTVFKLQKQPEPISTLDAPRGATVRRTEYVSQLEITWARVPGATIYEVEEEVGGADGSSHWQRVSLTTRPKLVVDGCRTNEFHNFRVCAVGTQVQSPYAFAFYNAAI